MNIGFQNAERMLVPLHGHGQGAKEPLGGIVVHDDPLSKLDWLRGESGQLGVEPKINN